MSVHEDKGSGADKAEQNELIGVALGTHLTRLKPNDHSKVNNTLPAEEDTKVGFILRCIYDDFISSLINLHAEPAAKAQMTAAVAPNVSTILVDIIE